MLLAVAVILLSLAGLFFGVVPLGQRVLSLWNQQSVLAREITTLTGKSAILQSLNESTLRNNLQILTSAVPVDKSIGTIFATLDQVSGIDVAIKDFQLMNPGSISTSSAKKLSADETKIGSNILPFSVTVTGNYNSIRTFLSDITAVRRLFRLRAVDVTFTGFGVDTRLSLDAFYFPYPKTVGAVASPITALTDKEETTISMVSSLPLRSSLTFVVGTASAVPTTGKSDPFSP